MSFVFDLSAYGLGIGCVILGWLAGIIVAFGFSLIKRIGWWV